MSKRRTNKTEIQRLQQKLDKLVELRDDIASEIEGTSCKSDNYDNLINQRRLLVIEINTILSKIAGLKSQRTNFLDYNYTILLSINQPLNLN